MISFSAFVNAPGGWERVDEHAAELAAELNHLQTAAQT
jgi:hypothetical protein